MNRAERRQIAKRAPRGTHKAVSVWLKDRCQSCLIGDHKHCQDRVACVCGCAEVKAREEKQGEQEQGKRRLWRPWNRRRS